MIPQEHRIIAALDHLGPLVVPEGSLEHWHVFQVRARDCDIQDALDLAGLPSFDWPGRRIFTTSALRLHAESSRGISDTLGYWARIWCRAVGLPHRSAWDEDVIVDPITNRRSTMTAHERIQLLREQQAVAENLARPRTSAPTGTDIPSMRGEAPC